MAEPLEIFIPFWGEPELLYETIRSVLAQDDPGWTLVVIDDCYPDPSVAAWFEGLADSRVVYTRNEVNLGITANYERAIQLATRPFITILGCDDLMDPGYVRLIRTTIDRVPAADVIQPGVRVIDGEGRVVLPLADRVKRWMQPRGAATLTGEQMATDLLRGNWLYWPALTFRVAMLREVPFRAGFPIIQDLALLVDVAHESGTLAFEPEVAFSYRRHGGSASQRSVIDGTRFVGERRYFALAAEQAHARGWARAARVARWRMMSRFQAASLLPEVLRARSRPGIRSVLTHMFGRPTRLPSSRPKGL